MEEYALFMGCIAPTRTLGYDISTRNVLHALGIELRDLNFSCCGFPVQSVKQDTAFVMAARNLALAEKAGLGIITICGACSFSLSRTQRMYEQNRASEIEETLNELGLEYHGGVRIRHFARLLYEDYGLDKIKEKVTHPLEGLRFAVHYGCYYHKPSHIYDHFDDPDTPVSLDMLVAATGAEALSYEEKMQCCGGALLGIAEEKTLEMSREKLEHVKAVDADAVVIVCPFCGVLYDTCQKDIEDKFNQKFNIPVLYYPQVLGLAMGLDEKSLALHKNIIKPTALLEKIGNK